MTFIWFMKIGIDNNEMPAETSTTKNTVDVHPSFPDHVK
jgi:hypothetical protein